MGSLASASELLKLFVSQLLSEMASRVTRMVEFIIVDQPSVYNITLGKPTLNALKTVVSTYQLAIKFLTPNGVKIFRGNQEGARKCYM